MRLRAAVSAVAALVLVAAIAGGYSASQHQQAIRNAAVVHSTDLAAVAAGTDTLDPGMAAQFAVASYRSAPTEQASAELYSVTNTPVDRVVDDMGPAGGTLLVSAQDSVFMIDTDPAALASRLCQDAAGSLTQAQWSRYAANIPYRNPCP